MVQKKLRLPHNAYTVYTKDGNNSSTFRAVLTFEALVIDSFLFLIGRVKCANSLARLISQKTNRK
jgi:hypothetical protein